MTEKLRIVSTLGEKSLLLPSLINAALSAKCVDVNAFKSGRTLAVFNQTRVWAEALWLVLGAAQKMGEADWVAIARISFPEAGL